MSSRSQLNSALRSVPSPEQSYLDRGYGTSSESRQTHSSLIDGTSSTVDTRPTTAQSHNTNHQSSAAMEDSTGIQRSASRASTTAGDGVSRSNTLKKRNSLSRKGSLKRTSSRKSLRAGSIKGVVIGDGPTDDQDYNSAFYTPIPTHSSPTDILANRFQTWRAFLKSLITYFREIQTSYDSRAKAIMKVSNVISNTQPPTVFMSNGGLNEAHRILNDYHKHALSEANKAKEIEQDVIQALNGLRADLGAKIKEIKSLSGDFKNSVDKEKDGTKRAVAALDEALQHSEHSDGQDKGKNDPFIVRLNVDRMVERQIDEENYLHRAYLNLENSGRELESIVVGEIQKAYNALAGILKREGDDNYNTVELLRTGPISMQKDLEWNEFVSRDQHLVDADLPLRRVQDITYPGKFHPAAAEIRAGMLERKSKYLKSYAPGWYVLSPTHLHEFKSADNIYSQPPVMSLYLADQKLGSHSGPESGSHKFMLKGRQSGGMHRGHAWVFRAESYDTMMAWFDAIKSLTEKTGAEKTAYVRKHARSISANSARAMSISSDGMEEDEADEVPYAASVNSHQVTQPAPQTRPQRPQPGGRFPSDLAVPRREPLNNSDYSSDPDLDQINSPNVMSGSKFEDHVGRPRTPPQQDITSYDGSSSTNPYALQGVATHENSPNQQRDRVASDAPILASQQSYRSPIDIAPGLALSYAQSEVSPISRDMSPTQPVETQTFALPLHSAPTHQVQPTGPSATAQPEPPITTLEAPHQLTKDDRHGSTYGDWMAPTGQSAGLAADSLHPQEPAGRFSTSTQPSALSTDTDLTQDSAPAATSQLKPATTEAPPVTRQLTDYSVSALHVPGEFPKSGA